MRNKFISENLFLKVTFKNSETYLSVLDGVHHSSLKEIEFALRHFFENHTLDFSNIKLDTLFFNTISNIQKSYHPEMIFAIEAVLLNYLDIDFSSNSLLTNDLFDWNLQTDKDILDKYKKTRCLKIKINPKTNTQKLSHILNLLISHTKEIKFRFDANKNFEVLELLFFLENLENKCSFSLSDHLEYLEEPLKSHNDLLSFKKIYKTPYAVDESVGSFFNDTSSSIDIFVIKPSLFGISFLYDFIEKNKQTKKIIISSCFEHPSVLNALELLASLRPSEHHGIICELSLENI